MKVIIISDSHRVDTYFIRMLGKEAPFDMLVHAGDFQGNEDYYDRVAGELPFEYVMGNCDNSYGPTERVFFMDRYRTFLTHGHRYRVHDTTDVLVSQARAKNCRIAVFGHTHIPGIEWIPDGACAGWRDPDGKDSPYRLESWRTDAAAGWDLTNGLLLMNPGSIGLPRPRGARPSYIAVNIDRGGVLDAQVRYL